MRHVFRHFLCTSQLASSTCKNIELFFGAGFISWQPTGSTCQCTEGVHHTVSVAIDMFCAEGVYVEMASMDLAASRQSTVSVETAGPGLSH